MHKGTGGTGFVHAIQKIIVGLLEPTTSNMKGDVGLSDEWEQHYDEEEEDWDGEETPEEDPLEFKDEEDEGAEEEED